MKKYMYKTMLKSPYGVRSIWSCSDKAKLEQAVIEKINDGFSAGTIYKCKRDYCTDENTEVWVDVI